MSELSGYGLVPEPTLLFAGGARNLHPLRGLIDNGPSSHSLGVPLRVRLAFFAPQISLVKLDRVAKELTQSFAP